MKIDTYSSLLFSTVSKVEGITGIYLANRIRQVQSASTPTTLASSFISFDKGGQ